MPEKIRVERDPVNSRLITLIEANGTRTTLHESDSYGLVIKQISPHGTKAKAMYGNDEVGYELYIHLLNYLLATRQPIPRFTRVRSLADLDFMKDDSLHIKTEYEIVQPLPSTHVMEINWNGTVTPVQEKSGKTGIAFGVENKPPLFLSNELIPALIRVIPRLFHPRERGFQVIYTHMMKPEIRKMIRPMHFIPYEKIFPAHDESKTYRPKPPAERRTRIRRKRR